MASRVIAIILFTHGTSDIHDERGKEEVWTWKGQKQEGKLINSQLRVIWARPNKINEGNG